MRGLTLTQPWASLVAIGAKTIETRSWGTAYRGPLAIHAGQGLGLVGGAAGLRELVQRPFFAEALRPAMMEVRQDVKRDLSIEEYPDYNIENLPRGAIIAVARLVECVSMDLVFGPGAPDKPNVYRIDDAQAWEATPYERAFGDFSAGRYAWLLADVQPLPKPIAHRGAQRLWNVPEKVEKAIWSQLR